MKEQVVRMGMRRRSGLGWCMALWWVVSTVAGIMALVVGGAALGFVSGGGYVGGILGGSLLGGGSYDPGSPIAPGYIGGMLGGAFGGAAGGGVTGLGQWAVVRRWVGRPLPWIGVTIAGFALAGALTAGGFAGGALGRAMGGINPTVNRSGEALVWALSLALFGGGAAVGQLFLLRPYIRKPVVWIVTHSAAWPVGWVGGYMLSKLTGQRIGLRLSGILPYPSFYALGELVGWLVGWAVVGVITWMALRDCTRVG